MAIQPYYDGGGGGVNTWQQSITTHHVSYHCIVHPISAVFQFAFPLSYSQFSTAALTEIAF